MNATLTNTARVAAAEPDIAQADNRASAVTTISVLPSLAGRIADAQGNALSGVAVSLSGSATAARTTDANGFYQFASLPSGGNYTVTATRSGYSLEPASRSFNNLTTDQTANFIASTCSYALTPTS